MHHRSIWLAVAWAAVAFGGCFGSNAPYGSDDASYGSGPDMTPPCSSNNNGIIEPGELVFPLGLSANYLLNPPGTTVAVAPVGGPAGPGGPEWDFTSTAGEVHAFQIEPMAGLWFASSFPDATYATISDVGTDTLGIFRVTGDAVLLLGFASRAPGPMQTLLVYDAPVATLRLPLQVGEAWVTGAKITGGTLGGQPFAESDTYQISVDEKGIAVLPFLRLSNTLRIKVELSQALPGGTAITHIQYLFMRECSGEVGRMVSTPGETNAAFTTASEFRRLAL